MKFISGVFKFFAILIMFLVIVLLPISLFTRNVGQVIFSRDVISELIEEEVFDEETLATLAEDLLSSSTLFEGEDGEPSQYLELMGGALEKLEHEDWVELINTITPTNLLSNTFDSIFNGFHDWLDNEEYVPQVVIDLRPWKRNTIQNATPVMEIILSVLPDCTANQIGDYIINLGLNIIQVSEVPSIPLCKPTDPYYSLLVDKGLGVIPSVTENIPDEINLADQFGEAEGDLLRAKQILTCVRFLLRWSWVIILLLFLVALPMGARDFGQFFKWAGWPIIFSGGIVFVFAFSLSILTPWLLARFSMAYFNDIPDPLSAVIRTILSALTLSIAIPLRNQGLLLLLVGGSFFVLAYVIERFRKQGKPRPGLSDQMRIPGTESPLVPPFSLEENITPGPDPNDGEKSEETAEPSE